MAYQKKTLRRMLPVTRKLARLIGEIDSVARRAKKLVEEFQHIEIDSQALWKIHEAEQKDGAGEGLGVMDRQILSKATQEVQF